MTTQDCAEPPSIELQFAADDHYSPDADKLRQWALVAAQSQAVSATVRIVSGEEIRKLNRDYRNRDKVTNVLSFPSEFPPELDLPYLGDIAICAEVVNREAEEQGKPADNHWAHMVIHAMLHLRGYDHIDPADAAVMEALEIRLLQSLDIPDPYYTDQAHKV